MVQARFRANTRISSGVAALAVVILALAVSACDRADTLEPLPGKVTLGVSKSDTGALVWIAWEKGFFREAGLELDLQPYSSGKAAMDHLVAGEIDLATSAEFVLVQNSFRDSHLRIIASTATANTIRVYGRRDRGVSAPADLRGKRIGVTIGSTGEYFLGRFLTAQNIESTDITPVDLSPPDVVQAMAAGDIDAAITWQPHGRRIVQQLGDGLAIFPGQEGQPFYFVLVSRTPWLTQHPEHAERIMVALHRTEIWMNEHPEETRGLIASLFNVDADYVQETWDLKAPHLNFPQGLMVAMDAERRWAIQKGLVNGDIPINFMDFIWLEPLERANPSLVTVIR